MNVLAQARTAASCDRQRLGYHRGETNAVPFDARTDPYRGLLVYRRGLLFGKSFHHARTAGIGHRSRNPEIGTTLKNGIPEPAGSKNCTNIEIDALTLVTSLDFSQIADLEDLSITSAYEAHRSETRFHDPRRRIAQRRATELSGAFLRRGDNRRRAHPIEFQRLGNLAGRHQTRGKSFYPGSCSELTTLSLPDLEIADSLFKIFSFNKLTTVNAPALTRAGDLSFESNYELQNLEFPVLQEVTRTFNYEGASWEYGRSQVKITGFPGLSALKKVGKITISGCGHLTDFTGLKNTLASLTADDWSVTDCAYNPTYEQMKNGEYKNNAPVPSPLPRPFPAGVFLQSRPIFQKQTLCYKKTLPLCRQGFRRRTSGRDNE